MTLDQYVENDEKTHIVIEWSGPKKVSEDVTPIKYSNNIYTSNLTISHLETQDSGIYTCTVTVTGGHYVQQTNASDSISITVDQKKITGVYIHLTCSHPDPRPYISTILLSILCSR